MNRRIAPIIAATVVALIGTVALIGFVRGAEDRAQAGHELVEVLVVQDSVPAGTSVADLSGLVRPEAVPKRLVVEGAISELSSVSGLVTSVELLAGETLRRDRLIEPARFVASAGVVEVPEGFHQVTVAIGPEQSVGAIIKPGDTVGIIAIFDVEETGQLTKLLHQKVLVTNVQGVPTQAPSAEFATSENRAPAPGGGLLVTLALSGPDAERLIFARSFGELHMTLQPADGPESSVLINFGNVLG